LALATRWYGDFFWPIVRIYGGDVIWAGMCVFLLRAFLYKTALWKLSLFAYTLGVIIECSQAIHTRWLDEFRRTMAGKLLLGQGFMWSDIVCYAVGVLMAWGIIYILEKRLLKLKA
jgi:hypothetical protein